MVERLGIFNTPAKGLALETEMVSTTPTPQKGAVMVDEGLLSKAEISSAMPSHLKSAVSDSLVDRVNSIANDPLEATHIRDNFVSYTHVLKEGKFKVDDYLSAAAYCTYKMMGFNNQDAYARTFPDRVRRLRTEGKDTQAISSYVSAYNKTKLVNLIWEQTLIAPWVLNQDLHQQALYVQADLMVNAKSEMVRTTAANSILSALKRPEDAKITLDVDVKDVSGITELKEQIGMLAAQQTRRIEEGDSTKTIAHSEIYDRTQGAQDAEEA